MVELPAPPQLAESLRLWKENTLGDPTSDLWKDWIGESHDEWHSRNKELAAAALSGDDDALVELVRRDFTIIRSDLLVAKIWEAKAVLYNARDAALKWLQEDDPEGQMLFAQRVQRAKRFLHGVGRAIAWGPPQGAASVRFEPSDVVSFFASQQSALKRLWAEAEINSGAERSLVKVNTLGLSVRAMLPCTRDGHLSTLRLARKYGATLEAVVELLISPRGGTRAAALAATAHEFGMTEDAVTKVLQRKR